MKEKWKNWCNKHKYHIVELLLSTVILTIFSRCSFLYEINPWCDPNFYITVARKMQKGQVLYRDIFEQKGPIIYYIHYLACLLFDSSFAGVYIFEIIACLATANLLDKIFNLYLDSKNRAMVGTLLTICIIYSSRTFAMGDSAEEFCFPFLLYGLYCTLNFTGGNRLTRNQYLLAGGSCGFVFWTKYTLLGLYVGIALLFFVIQVRKKEFKEIGKCICNVMTGFSVISLATLTYFVKTHAVNDLIFTYIIVNTAYYSNKAGLSMLLACIVNDTIKLLYDCPLTSILIGIGIIHTILINNSGKLLILIFTTSLPLFLGLHIWTYYYYPLQLFTIFGTVYILQLNSKNSLLAISTAGLLTIMEALPTLISDNNLTWLYKFKPWFQQTANPTLYLYQCEEAEFYTAYGIIPEEKYYITWNIQFPEMIEEQEQAAMDSRHDFIITEIPQNFPGYQCVDQSIRNENGYNEIFYLYKRSDI